MNNKTTEGAKRNLTRGLALGMLFAVAACDTTVTNPGPISSRSWNSTTFLELLAFWLLMWYAAVDQRWHGCFPSRASGRRRRRASCSYGVAQERGQPTSTQVTGR